VRLANRGTEKLARLKSWMAKMLPSCQAENIYYFLLFFFAARLAIR